MERRIVAYDALSFQCKTARVTSSEKQPEINKQLYHTIGRLVHAAIVLGTNYEQLKSQFEQWRVPPKKFSKALNQLRNHLGRKIVPYHRSIQQQPVITFDGGVVSYFGEIVSKHKLSLQTYRHTLDLLDSCFVLEPDKIAIPLTDQELQFVSCFILENYKSACGSVNRVPYSTLMVHLGIAQEGLKKIAFRLNRKYSQLTGNSDRFVAADSGEGDYIFNQRFLEGLDIRLMGYEPVFNAHQIVDTTR